MIGWCITMNCYEKLLDECFKENIVVVEKRFKSKAKGLWKNKKIGISNKLSTIAEKTCILAEEYGHYKTTVGDITDQTNISNIKQEKLARRIAIEKLCSLDKIVNTIRNGAMNKYDIIEMLNITEELFDEAIAYYSSKQNDYITDDIILHFDNKLQIYRKYY